MTPDQWVQSLPSSSAQATPPAVGQPPWMAGRTHVDGGSENNVSVTDSPLEKEDTKDPSTSARDRRAPMSNSLNRHEDSLLAQQARKAAFMYGDPLQELRANIARASALGDETLPGAHHSKLTLGTEPSWNHSAGTSGSPLPFYSRMKDNKRTENEDQIPVPLQQQHPNIQEPNVAAGHAPGTSKTHPCTAQLTIFYAGTVNVYEDVPFDKAQAIMLLGDPRNAWSSSNYTNMLASGVPNPGRPFSTPVELPQARKKSLARFLEKRKDRVHKGS